MIFGPFSVTSASVAALGASFTIFVNRLLTTETAAHDLVGSTLETTYSDNLSDGGVDAELHDSV